MAARWKKQPSETGLARVCQTERGLILSDAGHRIITVAPNCTNGGTRAVNWYWYGMERNTYSEKLFFTTKEEAKTDADNAFKEWRKNRIE